MSDHIEILDAEFPVKPAKFLELMWSDGDFWRSICDQQGIFDFETVERSAERIETKSKVKMMSNDTLSKIMKSIPTHCDQHSEILISTDEEGALQLESFSNSSNYPYAESFTVIQIYKIVKIDNGMRLTITGRLEWKDNVNFMVKPFIKKDVHRTLTSYGTFMKTELTKLK